MIERKTRDTVDSILIYNRKNRKTNKDISSLRPVRSSEQTSRRALKH